MKIFERGVEHAGFDNVLTAGAATATPVLHTTVMHRAKVDASELVDHAVIAE
jgi:hypothetical protein